MSQGYPEQPKSSGGMSTVMIVVIVLVVLFLLCAGICGGMGYFGSVAVREVGRQATQVLELLAPTSLAQTQIQASDEVVAKFGDPLVFGPPTREGDATGELNLANAHFSFSVSGPNASGTAHVKAGQVDGVWKVNEITLKCSDGTDLIVPVSDVLAPPELDFNIDDPAEEMPK